MHWIFDCLWLTLLIYHSNWQRSIQPPTKELWMFWIFGKISFEILVTILLKHYIAKKSYLQWWHEQIRHRTILLLPWIATSAKTWKQWLLRWWTGFWAETSWMLKPSKIPFCWLFLCKKKLWGQIWRKKLLLCLSSPLPPDRANASDCFSDCY